MFGGGKESGKELEDGDYNIFIGYEAGTHDNKKDSDEMIAIGKQAKAGPHCISLGTQAGGDGAGQHNICFGQNSGAAIVSGADYNVCIGTEAGEAITTGDNNTCIGYQSDVKATNSNQIAIGYGAVPPNHQNSDVCQIGNHDILYFQLGNVVHFQQIANDHAYFAFKNTSSSKNVYFQHKMIGGTEVSVDFFNHTHTFTVNSTAGGDRYINRVNGVTPNNNSAITVTTTDPTHTFLSPEVISSPALAPRSTL